MELFGQPKEYWLDLPEDIDLEKLDAEGQAEIERYQKGTEGK